jgi:hypothetical protein
MAMDRNVLKDRMLAKFDAVLDESLKAVEGASDGQWIAESEWRVRELFQSLTAECFREALQMRIDAERSAKQAAFSPSGKSGTGAAKQRRSPGGGVDRQR